jgi:hypothetical protein
MEASQCGNLSPNVENAIRTHLSVGNGILKVAAMVGVESSTVWRIKREMVAIMAEAACQPTELLSLQADTIKSGEDPTADDRSFRSPNTDAICLCVQPGDDGQHVTDGSAQSCPAWSPRTRRACGSRFDLDRRSYGLR